MPAPPEEQQQITQAAVTAVGWSDCNTTSKLLLSGGVVLRALTTNVAVCPGNWTKHF